MGVRNALIRNLDPLERRGDVGQLWENFCMLEKRKYNDQYGEFFNQYFWRTYDQQDIDLVEEGGGVEHGYEFKWRDQGKKVPIAFAEAYPKHTYTVINQANIFENFLKIK